MIPMLRLAAPDADPAARTTELLRTVFGK